MPAGTVTRICGRGPDSWGLPRRPPVPQQDLDEGVGAALVQRPALPIGPGLALAGGPCRRRREPRTPAGRPARSAAPASSAIAVLQRADPHHAAPRGPRTAGHPPRPGPPSGPGGPATPATAAPSGPEPAPAPAATTPRAGRPPAPRPAPRHQRRGRRTRPERGPDSALPRVRTCVRSYGRAVAASRESRRLWTACAGSSPPPNRPRGLGGQGGHRPADTLRGH